jgi:hypothetical protein
LTECLDWRWCFLSVGVAALVAVGIGVKGLERHPVSSSVPLFSDTLGIILSCIGLFLVISGFFLAEGFGWSDGKTLASLSAGGALLVFFILHEGKVASPLLPLHLFGETTRVASYLVMVFAGWAQMGSLVYLTYYLQDNLGFSQMVTGFGFLPLVIGLVIASAVSAKWFFPDHTPEVAFSCGVLVQGFGFQVLTAIGASDSYTPSVLFGLFLIGVGMGISLPLAFSAGTRRVAERFSGVASALLNSMQQLGASFGVAFLGAYATCSIAGSIAANADDADRMVASAQAYASGFQIMAVSAFILALVLGLLALVAKCRRQPSGIED